MSAESQQAEPEAAGQEASGTAEVNPVPTAVWVAVFGIVVLGLAAGVWLALAGGIMSLIPGSNPPDQTMRWVYVGVVAATSLPFALLAMYPRSRHRFLTILLWLSIAALVASIVPALPFAVFFVFALGSPGLLLPGVVIVLLFILPALGVLVLTRLARRERGHGSRAGLVTLSIVIVVLAVAMGPLVEASAAVVESIDF